MISDLGMPATPVGLLLALQYVLLPISMWVGHRSDSVRLFGRRRDAYIWLGRLLMITAFPLLGISVGQFESGNPTSGWIIATISFLLFGGGKLASGSVFLALVRESAPPEKRGLAVSMVETVLIVMFPIVAISFGRWMENYEYAVFMQLVFGTAVLGAFFWWFAIFRMEDGVVADNRPTIRTRAAFVETFGRIWGNPTTRSFFIFLGLATLAAWMQDNVLEPFGGDVFDLPAGVTTRFTGYWGGATVILVIACFWFLRRQRPEDQAPLTSVGLAIMAAGMFMLTWVCFTTTQSLLTPALIVFGAGFGFYTFGGLSLMMVMSPGKNAGAYLGLWTACILLTKGLGTFLGGALRDLFLRTIGLSTGASYGLIFAVAAILLLIAALLVTRLDFPAFTAAQD